MKCFQANSRQDPVVLNLVFQRRQLLCNGLAFLDLLGVLLVGDSFVHIVDSTSLVVRCVSMSSHLTKKDDFSIRRRVERKESYHDYGPSVTGRVVGEGVLVRRVRRSCIQRNTQMSAFFPENESVKQSIFPSTDMQQRPTPQLASRRGRLTGLGVVLHCE